MSDNAMRMDLGFGNTALTSPPFTIIADNPMFTTPAFEPGDMNSIHGVGSSFNNGSTSINNYNFDMNALTSWQTPAQSTSVPESMFDDLFQGYLKSLAPSDIMSFMGSTPSISPIAHASSMNSRLSSAPTSSPSILGQEPLFTRAASSSTSDAENLVTQTADTCVKCPKTKEQCREKIAKEGDSMFAPPIQKDHDQVLGPMISCAGSSFPKTEKNDQNVEVLTAWKSIRSDPMFKDVDITELCHEFTKKACCDGTKVVLEPGAVTEIKDNLSKSRNQ
jgi:AP-1-like factor